MKKRYQAPLISFIGFMIFCLSVTLSPHRKQFGEGLDFSTNPVFAGDDKHSDGHDDEGHGDEGHGDDKHDDDGHDDDGHDDDDDEGNDDDEHDDNGHDDANDSATGGAAQTFEGKPTVKQY